MTNDSIQEQVSKAYYADKAAKQSQGSCGSNLTQGAIHTSGLMAGRTSLRERINNQRYRAETESRNAALLAELDELLDKHPDLARILDLLELVKG